MHRRHARRWRVVLVAGRFDSKVSLLLVGLLDGCTGGHAPNVFEAPHSMTSTPHPDTDAEQKEESPFR